MSRQNWAEANAQIGLQANEICPGLTVEQHAESIAMWDCRNMPTNNRAQALAVSVVSNELAERFYGSEDTVESQ